jgi:hypothetical protein
MQAFDWVEVAGGQAAAVGPFVVTGDIEQRHAGGVEKHPTFNEQFVATDRLALLEVAA